MAMDFWSLLQSGQIATTNPNKTLVDLNLAVPTNTWATYMPNTSSASVNRALNAAINAPDAGWWENFKRDMVNFVQRPGVQLTLNTLDAPRNAVFNVWDNWLDGELNWNDIPINAMAEGFIGSFTGDKADTSSLFDKLGWEAKPGWQSGDLLDNTRDVVTFLGDVAGDPLTYLTFGAGSVAKASANAARQALEAGLQRGTREFDDFVQRAAQAQANNQALGFNVPFGPEVPLAPKPDFLKVKSQNVGQQPAVDLATKMEQMGLAGQQRYDFASQVLGRPITSFKQLNTQEWNHLNNLANRPDFSDAIRQFEARMPDPFAPNSAGGTTGLPASLRQFTEVVEPPQPSNLPATLNDLEGLMGNNLLGGTSVRYGGSSARDAARNVMDAEFADVLPGAMRSSADDAVTSLSDALAQQFGNYRHFEGAEGVSDLGRWVQDNVTGRMEGMLETLGRYFGGQRYVPASVSRQDHRIQDGVNALADARQSGFAGARAAVDEMERLASDDVFKQLSREELETLPYLIEGKFPDGMSVDMIAPDRLQLMQNAADKLRQYRDAFTSRELEAGANYTVRDNYFPHILNMPDDPADFEAMISRLAAVNPDVAARLQNAPRGFTRERKAFDTMADLRNFLNQHADNPEIQNMFGNATFNPLEAYARRAMAGAHEVARLNSFRQLQELGVARQLQQGEKVPKGWKEIDIPGLEKAVVPAEIHERLANINKLLTNDKRINKVLERWDKAYSIWRRNVTVVNPAFHLRQGIGNVFQNTLAGVTPKYYTEAVNVLRNNKSVKIGGQTMSADDIMKMAREDGVIGTGSTADYLTLLTEELGQRLNPGNIGQRLNPFSQHFVPGQVGRKVGEGVDDISRLAHYLFVLSKGGNRRIARESVIKHLYDYSNLTNFERVGMRTVMPFYAWMRNNLPFQIVQAAKRPGVYQVVNDLQSVAQNEPDIEALMDEMGVNRDDHRQFLRQLAEENGGVLPDYIQERYVNVGGNNYFNLGLPSSDLNMLTQSPFQTLVESGNPLFAYLYGMSTNRNSLGTPINRYGDEVDMPSGIRYTMEQLGGYPGRLAAAGLSNLAPSVVAPNSANERDWYEQLLRLLGVTQVDPVTSLEGLLYQAEREANSNRRRQRTLEGLE